MVCGLQKGKAVMAKFAADWLCFLFSKTHHEIPFTLY